MLTLGQACVYFLEAFGALPPELMAAKFMNLTPDEQEMMKSFLSEEGETIMKARVDALKNEALAPLATKTGIKEATNPPKAGGNGGSGNNNKSRASRSSEQKGGAKSTQGMSARLKEALNLEQGDEGVFTLDEMVDLFAKLQQMVNDDLNNAGIPVPEVTAATRKIIRQNLVDLAAC